MRRWTVALATLTLWVGAAATAYAGGFEHPTNGTRALGRGGAFTAMANDLTALDYNPAGLLHNKGWHLMLSNNITDFKLKFTQTALDDDGAPTQLPSVKNSAGPFLLAPVFGVSTDILHPDVRVALGVYGPSAYGRSTFNPDGPQRYMLTETDITIVYYTAAVAWQPFKQWGLGLSLHWIDMMAATMGMTVSGWLDTDAPDDIKYAPNNSSYDVHSRLKVSDHFNFAATLGTWVRPIQRLRIGASLRFPFDEGFANNIEATGDASLRFTGDMTQALYQQGLDTNGAEGLVAYHDDKAVARIPVTFNMKLPMVARLGIQYIHPLTEDEQLFDIELDVVWEGWSVLEQYRVDMDGYMKLTGKGVQGEANEQHFRPVIVPKKFRDTWSVRLGGDVRIQEWLQARMGGYYETGAVPNAYTNVDFASFDRIGAAAGLTFHWRWFDLSFAYSHIFQMDRIVSHDTARVYTQFPMLSEDPLDEDKVNAGKYETSFDIYSLSLEAKF
ncbi:MAG: outer membrane protein transport protein [Pseudomonadota bacterium]